MSKRKRKKSKKEAEIPLENFEKKLIFAEAIKEKAINNLWRWDTLEDVKL